MSVGRVSGRPWSISDVANEVITGRLVRKTLPKQSGSEKHRQNSACPHLPPLWTCERAESLEHARLGSCPELGRAGGAAGAPAPRVLVAGGRAGDRQAVDLRHHPARRRAVARRDAELTRAPRGCVGHMAGCAWQPPALGTYRWRRAACPQGPASCTYGVRAPASGAPRSEGVSGPVFLLVCANPPVWTGA